MESSKENKPKEIRDLEERVRYFNHQEEFLLKRYDFRYNIVTGRIEYIRYGTKEEFAELNDFDTNSILREMKYEDKKISRITLDQLLKSDFSPSYNPFHDYLNNLPDWDKQEDWILRLAETINTPNQLYWHHCLKKWLVALVGSMLEDEIINHEVIVLCGKQGIGKTRWINKIVPQQLRSYWYSGTINPENKDTYIYLSECMLINLDELENLQRKELGSLKELITKPNIRFRRPYDRYADNLPHRASFIGSVNHKQFLMDSTGSRRFLCFDVNEIDYNHNIDINMVFAQAYQLFKDGHKYWFDGDEIDEIKVNNESFELKNLEEELVRKTFKPAPKSESQYNYQTSEVLKLLELEHGFIGKLNLIRLGRVLSKLKFERHKKGGVYVYALDNI